MSREEITGSGLDNLIHKARKQASGTRNRKQEEREGGTGFEPGEDRELLRELLPGVLGGKRVAVIGVGNVLRADDGVGPRAVALINERTGGKHVDLLAVDSATAPENVTSAIRRFGPQVVVFIDAAYLGENLPAGTVVIVPEDSVAGFTFSTHSLPLSVVISYLESEVDATFVVMGIQPATTESMQEMTPDVEDAAVFLSDLIIEAAGADKNR